MTITEEEGIQNYSEEDAMRNIQDIAEHGLQNIKELQKIETSLDSMNEHISSLDDYLVIQKKKEEEEKKKIEEKKEEEQKAESKSGEQTEEKTEEKTLDDIYEELSVIDSDIKESNTLQTVGIFSQGIIIGVLLLTIFWVKFFR